MIILNLEQATAYLQLNDTESLRRLAQRGEVPGRKVGREWRFVQEHLADWVSEQYYQNQQVLVSDEPEEKRECHFTNEMACGTSKSEIPTILMDHQYDAVLGLGVKR